MTHVGEDAFTKSVGHVLDDEYGESNVRGQYVFPSNREADFIAVGEWHTLAVEVENGAGSVLNGSGQAQAYAQMAMVDPAISDQVAYPLLVVPEGHIQIDERRFIERMGVGVRELPEVVESE